MMDLDRIKMRRAEIASAVDALQAEDADCAIAERVIIALRPTSATGAISTAPAADGVTLSFPLPRAVASEIKTGGD